MTKSEQTKKVKCCDCGKEISVPISFNEAETHCTGCFKKLKSKDFDTSAWFRYHGGLEDARGSS